ncbi:MAG TPA: radical SAM protein [Bacteroidales bacterium]|nr:radical SAM protein [Bacteroidales bacterium]HSA43114.1 radical SAM protein [Bacteroidales bacterium]
MSRIHFHETIFGPVHSRRLGISLGINLLPTNLKFCTFNCVYCECGWTEATGPGDPAFPSPELIFSLLEKRIQELKTEGITPHSLTLAGNGEPTTHPEFPAIVDGIIAIRNELLPRTRISVLSNASMLRVPGIMEALKKLDNNIQKLDAGTEEMFRLINQSKIKTSLREIVDNLKKFEGKVTIQTLFIRGSIDGITFDNTTEEEVAAWLTFIREINPKRVMLYSIERKTPLPGLLKVSKSELARIAAQVEKTGICAEFFD